MNRKLKKLKKQLERAGGRVHFAPEIPDDVVAQTRERYVTAYEKLADEPGKVMRGRRDQVLVISRPTICGSIWRRTVSASGNSGTDGV